MPTTIYPPLWSQPVVIPADVDNLTIPISTSSGFAIQAMILSDIAGDVNVLFRLNAAPAAAQTVVRRANAGVIDNQPLTQDYSGAAFPPGTPLAVGQMGGNGNRRNLWCIVTVYAGELAGQRAYDCKTFSLSNTFATAGAQVDHIFGFTSVVAQIDSVDFFTGVAAKIKTGSSYRIKMGGF